MSVDQIHDAFGAAEPVAPHPEQAPAPADPGGDDGGVPPIGPDEDLPEAKAAQYPLNDYGNGRRLITYYGDDILFVPRLGWYRWDGRRWGPDEDEITVRRDAQKIAGRILGEIEHIALADWQREALDLWRECRPEFLDLEKIAGKDRTGEQVARFAELRNIQTAGVMVEDFLRDARKAHRAHSKTSGNSNRISNMLAEAKVGLATTVGALNRDPLMVGCENGVLHFTCYTDDHDAAWGRQVQKWRVDLLPHDRRQMISKMALAEYDPQAECPHFLAFLSQVQPEQHMRDFLQRWFGYCITGLTTEQKLAFFFGGGRNGKSTLVDIIARILADYGTTIPIETLTGSEQRKGSDATPDLVRLPGARFVRASEPEQGQRMREALIKALTGGEAIMIRRMMQEFVEITPEFKLTISGNHKPEVRGSDDGIWRRILLVPWEQQIPADQVDRDLPRKLWEERAGILAWMVRGALDYLANGLQEPAEITEATEEYRRDSDPLRTFLTEECKITGSPEHFERGRDLADAFNAWLLDRGESVWGKRTVANALRARAGTMKGPEGHVYTPGKRSDTGYLGIELSQDAMNRIARYGEELRSGAQRKG